jgi:hypothetical protein
MSAHLLPDDATSQRPAIKAVRALAVSGALWKTALDELADAGASVRGMRQIESGLERARRDIVRKATEGPHGGDDA